MYIYIYIHIYIYIYILLVTIIMNGEGALDSISSARQQGPLQKACHIICCFCILTSGSM